MKRFWGDVAGVMRFWVMRPKWEVKFEETEWLRKTGKNSNYSK